MTFDTSEHLQLSEQPTLFLFHIMAVVPVMVFTTLSTMRCLFFHAESLPCTRSTQAKVGLLPRRSVAPGEWISSQALEALGT